MSTPNNPNSLLTEQTAMVDGNVVQALIRQVGQHLGGNPTPTIFFAAITAYCINTFGAAFIELSTEEKSKMVNEGAKAASKALAEHLLAMPQYAALMARDAELAAERENTDLLNMDVADTV